ncbi:MAG: hypothetical protein B7Z73_18320 [Planctomycetia bacterium 21-64-5]|nr:MAG: hypothetical protein B7Z73_18320 [Planctomycetia bacterium 21-64-5]
MQFSLRTLLLATTVAVVALGYCAERAHRQHAAAMAIERLHGSLRYNDAWNRSPVRQLISGWLGKDMMASVVAVYLGGTAARDADLACLEELPGLRELVLTSSAVSDAGLEQLRELRQLESLDVRFTAVSEAGVEKLRRALPRTKILSKSDID